MVDATPPGQPRGFRAARLAITLIALAAALITGLWWYVGRVGSTPLERWIGKQIVAAIEQHITPRVTYSDLDYQAPLTVVIDDLALLNGEERILAVHRATLSLAEIPREGQPVQIREIDLDRPILRFVADENGRMSGWSNFSRSRGPTASAPSQPRLSPAAGAIPRLSDLLVLRQASIRQGRILYDAGPGHPAMILPGIELFLATPPAATGDGWYECDGHLDRAPQMSLRFDTRVNINTGDLNLQSVRLDAALDEATYNTMPPAVQRFLADRNIRGRLTLTAKGNVPLAQAMDAAIDVEADFDRVYFTLGETAWPAERIDLDVSLADRRLRTACEARLLGGAANVRTRLRLDGNRDFDAQWQAAGVRLEETLRIAQGRTPKYSGRTNLQGNAQGTLGPIVTASGAGRVEITEGVLIALPILAELHALIGGPRPAPDGTTKGGTDHASLDFRITPTHFDVTDIEVVSTLAAMKGSGRIYFDGRLDLLVNAGPLKRLEKLLGPIGSLLGTITDRVAPYQIRGVIGNPSVSVRPLGL